jgi:hypothetical protein
LSGLNDIKLTPKQTIIALLFIVLILATLGLRLSFSNKATQLAGPNFIVATDEMAVMVYNTDLYRLDSKGNILQKVSFEQLGMGNKAADIQLLDKHRFIIGDWENERILSCDFRTVDCISLTRGLGKQLGNFFKFHYNQAQHEIFIADTDRHRILHYDTGSHQVNVISDRKQFIYPNHLQIEKDGYLYITDTNHHRIARFDIDSDSLKQVGDDIRISQDITSKKWPIHYYLDNDEMHVLMGNDFLLYADLVYIPDNGNAVHIPLKKNADVTTISQMGNSLLLSDRENFKLYRLDLSSHAIHDFGSHELQQVFQQDKKTTTTWELLSSLMLYLMILLIICMIGFIVYLSIKNKPQQQETDNSSQEHSADPGYDLPPITPGKLVWLEPNPLMRRVLLALFVLLTMMAGLVYVMIDMLNIDLSNPDNSGHEQEFLDILLLMAAVFFIAIVNALHNIYYAIGTDGIYIYIKTIFTRKKIRPRETLYNKQLLIKDNLLVPYRNNMQQYFHNKAQFETYIMPLLNAFSTRIGPVDLIKHMVTHPNILTIFNSISIGGVLIYMIQTGILFD